MHLSAVEAGTRDLLRDGLSELRSRLEDAGLRATHLDVATGDTPRQGSPGTPDPHRPPGPERAGARHGPAPPEPAALRAPTPRTDSRLDLRM